MNNIMIKSIGFSLLFLASSYGFQAQKMSGESDHVQFLDAGVKFDHIWISFMNFRNGRIINPEFSYTIYLLHESKPKIGPKRLGAQEMGRFPLIEFQVELAELGIDIYNMKKDALITLVLFATDSNTPRDSVFQKQMLSFMISKNIKSSENNRNISFPLSDIPLCYKYSLLGDNVAVVPVLTGDFKEKGNVRIIGFRKFPPEAGIILDSLDVKPSSIENITMRNDIFDEVEKLSTTRSKKKFDINNELKLIRDRLQKKYPRIFKR